MKKSKTLLIDKTQIPPNVSLEDYMKQMKNTMMTPFPTSPIYNIDFGSRFNPAERAIYNVTRVGLLHGMLKITDQEVVRLVGMIDSQDEENWTVAEECIKQKLS